MYVFVLVAVFGDFIHTQCLLRARGDSSEGFARIWKRLAKPGSLGINGIVAERMESIRAAGVDAGGMDGVARMGKGDEVKREGKHGGGGAGSRMF